MKVLLSIIIIFCVLSCKKNTTTTQELETENQKNSLQITKDDVSNLKYAQFILDPKTKVSNETWQKYAELNETVKQVNQADLSFFKENNEILLVFIKDLKEGLPDTINTPLINARLVALETKMLKLEGIVNLSNPDKEETLLVVRDFLSAFSNLNLQINKKFERESQNIEKPY